MNMAAFGADFESRSSYIRRRNQQGIDSGGEGEIFKGLLGSRSGLVFVELSGLDNEAGCP
jgi:hypothetical protein